MDGVFVDLDVTCLRPLPELEQPYVFPPHFQTLVASHLLKMPQCCEFAVRFQDHFQHYDENVADYCEGMRFLGNLVKELELERYILPVSKITDDSDFLNLWNRQQPESLCIIHWADSQSSSTTETAPADSYFASLLKKYNI